MTLEHMIKYWVLIKVGRGKTNGYSYGESYTDYDNNNIIIIISTTMP